MWDDTSIGDWGEWASKKQMKPANEQPPPSADSMTMLQRAFDNFASITSSIKKSGAQLQTFARDSANPKIRSVFMPQLKEAMQCVSQVEKSFIPWIEDVLVIDASEATDFSCKRILKNAVAKYKQLEAHDSTLKTAVREAKRPSDG